MAADGSSTVTYSIASGCDLLKFLKMKSWLTKIYDKNVLWINDKIANSSLVN